MRLADTKVGDNVILRDAYGSGRRVMKVEAATATQLTVGGKRYTRRSGHQVGYGKSSMGFYRGPWIEPATPQALENMREAAAQEERTRRRNQARHAMVRVPVTDDNLDAVEAFLKSQGVTP